jgi:hydroxymethylglutaryl-CoA lyase
MKTNTNYPKRVDLIEVGPRDGFQFETRVMPTEFKLDIINDLVEAGLKQIQVTSFVRPQRVPQMADAEELVMSLPEADGIDYSALVLNLEGVRRAVRSGLTSVEISISASDTHSRKNAGMSLEQAIKKGAEMIQLARTNNLTIRAGIQCVFGCVYEGRIPLRRVLDMAQQFLNLGVDRLALSDTTGMATPGSVKDLLEHLLPRAMDVPLIFHFHDTRGMGLVNVAAALEYGVSNFDTALGGMGGCPFVQGAAGNIATEDTAYLMAALDIETGVDISKVARCSKQLEEYFEKSFSGKMHRIL